MRVIINGVPLLDRRSGVGNYVYHTFKAMLAMQKEWDLSFYYGLQWSDRLKDQPLSSYVKARRFTPNIRKIYPLYRNTLALLFAVGQWTRKFDLYHETNCIPMQFSGPTILTIFDLSFLYFPEAHPIERIRYLDRHFYSGLSGVTHFITISESVKREMVEHLSLPHDKITAIPLGVEDSFNPISLDQLCPVMNKYGLKSKSYILYVGTLEPRKNILNLLRAYSMLPLALRAVYPLVLAGEMGWLMEKLNLEIERLKIQRTVIKTGYVPSEDLPFLYSGATIFVYPSLYEGFGLPLLEAMACGVPVVTSSVSSLPEVVGDAGVLVHPDDIESMSKEIHDLLGNKSRRQTLMTRGLERAKSFTWERCATETLEVYDVVGQKR